MANEFRIKNGLIIDNGGVVITGSLQISNGITGSFNGTSSNSITSSYALTAQNLLGSVTSASYSATSSYLLNNNIGEADLNFGNTPGTNMVSVTVSSSIVTDNSYINIYVMNTSSIDHNTEDHKIFALYSKIIPGNIISASSFDIIGITDLRLNGIFKIKYVINNF